MDEKLESDAREGAMKRVRYAVADAFSDDEIKTLLHRARLLRELAELAETHTSPFNEEVRERAERLRRLADVYERFGGECDGKMGS